MSDLLVFVITYISLLAHTIRGRAEAAVKKATDSSVLVVLGVFKAPPPTKTLPLGLTPTPTVSLQPAGDLWLRIGLFFVLALLVAVAALVKLGVLKTLAKPLRRGIQATSFVPVLPSFVGRTGKLDHRTLCAVSNIVTAALKHVLHSVLCLMLRLAGFVGHPLLAFTPPNLAARDLFSIPLPRSLPEYDAQQMQAALPDPDVLLDVSKSRPACRPVNGLGVKHTVDIAQLRFVKRLGSGAFGQVFKAESLDKTKAFAIKKIRKAPVDASRAATWESVYSEVQVHLLMSKNPAFPTIQSVFHDKTHFYLIMDLGQGSFAEFRPTSRLAALSYGVQLVMAVHALHQRGVVHLDIKPANLLLGADDKLVLIDYGIAHGFRLDAPQPADFPRWSRLRQKRDGRFPMLWPEADNPHRLRVRGGTPGYMSPPVLANQPCSYGADLWAVGMVLYEWLSMGARPTFHGNTWVPRQEHGFSKAEIIFFRRVCCFLLGMFSVLIPEL
ncbi:kinase-like domain-containing protein [Mycena haematopus]|nr:kinase-like domain-containing protein [Mycena haematopus]